MGIQGNDLYVNIISKNKNHRLSFREPLYLHRIKVKFFNKLY